MPSATLAAAPCSWLVGVSQCGRVWPCLLRVTRWHDLLPVVAVDFLRAPAHPSVVGLSVYIFSVLCPRLNIFPCYFFVYLYDDVSWFRGIWTVCSFVGGDDGQTASPSFPRHFFFFLIFLCEDLESASMYIICCLSFLNIFAA